MTVAKKSTSLTEFAKARQVKPGVHCRTCALAEPVLSAVNHGLRKGISVPTVRDWLRAEHNLAVSEGSLRGHRRRCLNVVE